MHFLALVLLAVLSAEVPASAGQDLHADFDVLLDRYVTETGVLYATWAATPEDLKLLTDYIDRLEASFPKTLASSEALAYWINLYNAATLELVLSHYPVESIKKTAGFLRSPWNKKLVTVEGKKLSLNAIENDIIRPQFQDARIHFALNCASVGCPMLAKSAYRGEHLEDQLDEACRRSVNDPRWVNIGEDRLVLSKIFDWYEEDFEQDAGSVVAFISRYRADGERFLREAGSLRVKHASYDWSLNESD